jgi:NitT/TauT family transport system substrate-binding protein
MRRKLVAYGRIWFTVLAVAGLVLGAAACGSDDDSESGSAASGNSGSSKTETLRVVLFPTTDMAGFWYALDNGIFKKHGLDVQPQEVTDATALTAAVTSGKADIMHHALPSMAQAKVGGLPVKMVSGVDNMPKEGYIEVLVRKDSGINSFKDLSGKQFGVAALHGIVDLGLYNAIDVDGGDSSKTKTVPIPPTEQPAALEAGRVDAIGLNDPFLAAALKNPKFKSLGNPFKDLPYTAPSASAYSTDQIIEKKASAIKKYQAAMIEAGEIVKGDPALARKTLAAHTQLTPDVLEGIGLPEYDGTVRSDSVSQVLSSIDELGWLQKPVTEDELVSADATTG